MNGVITGSLASVAFPFNALGVLQVALVLFWLAFSLFHAPPRDEPETTAMYELEVHQIDATELGSDFSSGPVLTVTPDAQLVLTLRPQEAVHRPITAHPFVLADGRAQPWSAPLLQTKDGVFVLQSSLHEISPPGTKECELVFFIGSEPLPSDYQAALTFTTAEPDLGKWQILRLRLRPAAAK